MTEVRLCRRRGALYRVEAEGHSGYADEGSDIVCAAITACFRLLNAQLDAAKVSQTVEQDERRAYLAIEADGGAIFEGFAALMRELSEEFPENITLTEVDNDA